MFLVTTIYKAEGLPQMDYSTAGILEVAARPHQSGARGLRNREGTETRTRQQDVV